MMKKIGLIGLLISLVFSSDLNLNQRVTKLENEVKLLKLQISKILKSQKEINISQTLIQDVVKKGKLEVCNNLKIVNFNYKYHNDYFKSYDLFYTLKNNYPKPIQFVKAYITIRDNEDNNLIEDFIKREIKIAPNSKKVIKRNYRFDADIGLSIYLKDTPLKNITIYFKPSIIKFQDGTTIKCNR